ncbi:2Fe-2S iron-sulfur cluster-binding protein [Wenjunlia tyrosinilytica]|uniref:Ferredoxin n=1 Tax=Wenjunlia tyrosinilytica TaxID=1544741 RepID=A0A917ZCA9_9ACTN|nr:2Fe-2S iron-sulfur cluster-binding protein [Wenjunlia tyrosinilytica]GGO80183.1 ferredoxin [Wenjunlia tyrosinilytica]
MPKVVYVHPDGSQDRLDVPEGTSVMQAAVAQGIVGIVAECGGSAMCATCHVYVDPPDAESLPAVGADEDEMLDCTACPREPGSRLSCRIVLTADLDGLTVRLPEKQR